MSIRQPYPAPTVVPAETDPLSLHLDPVSQQTIKTHIPLLTGLTPTQDYEIATKKYVDDNAGGFEVDGGFVNSVYLVAQLVDGGGA